MGIIYKLTCLKSGKSYIGQSVHTFTSRFADHKAAANNHNKKDGCRALNNTLRLYSDLDNDWNKEVLLECNDSQLDYYEIKLIELYNTLAPNGYNLRTGGQSRGRVSEETRELMKTAAANRDSDKYRKNKKLVGLKYIVERHSGGKHGYIIHRHPLTKDLYFVSSDINKMDWNLERCKAKLKELNDKLESNNKSQGCSSETKCSSVSSTGSNQ